MLAELTDEELLQELMNRSQAKKESLIFVKSNADGGYIAASYGEAEVCADLSIYSCIRVLNETKQQHGDMVALRLALIMSKKLSCI